MDDLALTAEGLPAVVVGRQRYPLCMTIAGMKAWAEHRGIAFDEALKGGWMASELQAADMEVLLREALRGGECRRQMFSDEPPRQITDELVRSIMDAFHPAELTRLLVRLWNEPPVRPPGPPMPAEQSPLGE